MEKRIVVAWPEDFVLTGDNLEELTTKLAPHAEVVSQVPQGPNIDLVVTEYETAIVSTLETLEALDQRTISHAALKYVMGTCLKRNVPAQSYPVVRTPCISIALDNLIERGAVVESITQAQLSLPEPQAAQKR